MVLKEVVVVVVVVEVVVVVVAVVVVLFVVLVVVVVDEVVSGLLGADVVCLDLHSATSPLQSSSDEDDEPKLPCSDSTVTTVGTSSGSGRN